MRNFSLKHLMWMIFVFVGFVFFTKKLVFRNSYRPEAPQNTRACQRQLTHIFCGLIHYEEVHGHFPPVCTLNSPGKPAHSWRVLILPYMGYEELYRRYDFSKPWNHPDNLKIADEGAHIYGNVPAANLRKNHTIFVAVEGDDSPWGKPLVSTPEDKGWVLIVESHEDQTHWMKPSDYSGNPIGTGIHGSENDQIFVAFSNFNVHLISVPVLGEEVGQLVAYSYGTPVVDQSEQNKDVSEQEKTKGGRCQKRN